MDFCPRCGAGIEDKTAAFCSKCGTSLKGKADNFGTTVNKPGVSDATTHGKGNADSVNDLGRSYLAGALLNIFLPGIGRIYLGDTGIGVAQLIVALLTAGIGALWSFIDGILILVNNL